MKPLTKTFSYHIDPALYMFRWQTPYYAEVDYCAVKKDGDIVVSVSSIKIAPYVLSMIILHNNWLNLVKEIEQAARHNAEVELNNSHVDETILQAIAPHI